MVSNMDARFSCIFKLCDVRMRIAMTCIVPRVYLRDPPWKKKTVSGGSFITWKSVKEELILKPEQRATFLLMYTLNISCSLH